MIIDNSSAVSMIGGTSGFSKNKLIQGVVRFIETQKGCIVDGTIDGLDPGDHGLHIHECGDISNGCESVGQHFNPYNCSHGGLEDDISNRVIIIIDNGILGLNIKLFFLSLIFSIWEILET